jgi:hypothetical protein
MKRQEWGTRLRGRVEIYPTINARGARVDHGTPGLLQVVGLEGANLGRLRSGDGAVEAHGGGGEREQQLPLGWGELSSGAGMLDDRSDGVHVGEVLEAGCAKGVVALVEVVGLDNLSGRDEGERAVDFCGVPGGVVLSQQVPCDAELRKDLRIGSAGVEQIEVLRELLLSVGEQLLVALEDVEVDAHLVLNICACVAGLVALVDVLDGLFEADGDDEAEDDGGDVDEEVFPRGSGVVSGVYVEHGGWLRCRVGWRQIGRRGVWRGGRRLGRIGLGVGHGFWGPGVGRVSAIPIYAMKLQGA